MAGSDWLVEQAIETTPSAFESVRAALGNASRQLGLQLHTDSMCRQIVLGARTEGDLGGALLYLNAVVADGYRIGPVHIAYRATPASVVEATYAHKKQSGSTGEFAEVILRVEPGRRMSGFHFFNANANGNIPAHWVPSVEKGIREAAERSDIVGLPLIDFEVHLIDGKYHDLDSSNLAFERAGAGAMIEAAKGAGIQLLEPIVKVAVLTPKRCETGIVKELERRRATIDNVKSGETSLIIGIARMADMLGFGAALGAATDGAASAAMVLHRYAEVTGNDGPDDTFPMAAALRA